MDTIVLRKPQESDYEALLHIKNDACLQRLLLAHYRPHTLKDLEDWLDRRQTNPSEDLLVISNERRVCMGFVQLTNIDAYSHNAYLGICLHSEYQSIGAGKKAMVLMQEYALSHYKISKILLEVCSSNQVAIRVYQSLGYSLVGHLKRHRYVNGEYFDVVLMENIIGER